MGVWAAGLSTAGAFTPAFYVADSPYLREAIENEIKDQPTDRVVVRRRVFLVAVDVEHLREVFDVDAAFQSAAITFAQFRFQPLLRQIEPICATLNGAIRAGCGVVAGLRSRRAMAGETAMADLRLTYIVWRTMLSGNDPRLSRQADEGICRR